MNVSVERLMMWNRFVIWNRFCGRGVFTTCPRVLIPCRGIFPYSRQIFCHIGLLWSNWTRVVLGWHIPHSFFAPFATFLLVLDLYILPTVSIYTELDILESFCSTSNLAFQFLGVFDVLKYWNCIRLCTGGDLIVTYIFMGCGSVVERNPPLRPKTAILIYSHDDLGGKCSTGLCATLSCGSRGTRPAADVVKRTINLRNYSLTHCRKGRNGIYRWSVCLASCWFVYSTSL